MKKLPARKIAIGFVCLSVLATFAVILFSLQGHSITAERQNTCVENLRIIASAKTSCGLAFDPDNSNALCLSNLALYEKGVDLLFCPEAPLTSRVFSECYSINEPGVLPTCKIAPDTHHIDWKDVDQKDREAYRGRQD